jgi:hypothetical protein
VGTLGSLWIQSFWGHFEGENASLLWEAGTLVELEEVIDGRTVY